MGRVGRHQLARPAHQDFWNFSPGYSFHKPTYAPEGPEIRGEEKAALMLEGRMEASEGNPSCAEALGIVHLS